MSLDQAEQPTELRQYVESELRGSADGEAIAYLNNNKALWRNELVAMKRRAETQMTSNKARKFEAYCDFWNGNVTQADYFDKVAKERVWKTNASRFIQQIETRLVALRNAQ